MLQFKTVLHIINIQSTNYALHIEYAQNLVSCEKEPHEELAAFPIRPGTIQGHILRPHIFNVPWEVLATAI